MSRKWLRETPWKLWLQNGASINADDSRIDLEVKSIIQDCLVIPFSDRHSSETLEAQLLAVLKARDAYAYETLEITLAYFDKISLESEESGWPYYEDRLRQLNDAFADNDAEN